MRSQRVTEDGSVPWTPAVFCLAAALYTGFQWTIRVVVYPQFAEVPAGAFVPYERQHQRRVSLAVGPLFVLLGVSAILLFTAPPHGVSRWWGVAGGAGVAAILGVTAFLAVPLHRALGDGFTVSLHRRLLRVDTVRLVLAVLTTAVGAWASVTAR